MMKSNNLSSQEIAALNEFVRILKTRFANHLLDVLLFGSKARGDTHPESDLDVLVILDVPDTATLGEVRAIGFDILLAYGVFINIIALNRYHWQELADMNSLFYQNVVKDGLSFLPEPIIMVG